MGVRHSLFPTPMLGTHRSGSPVSRRHSPRQAELTFGLIAGPLILVARRSILSEASWLASATSNIFEAACEPGQDTLVTAFSRLDHFALGRPPLLIVRWPSATGLTSYLSGCFSLTSQRSCFTVIADVSEGFNGLAWAALSFPVRSLTLSHLSVSFVWPMSILLFNARVARTVLMHSSNRLPSG